jgi:glucose uptake protein GlcU
MVVPHSYLVALLMTILTMTCWGSWAIAYRVHTMNKAANDPATKAGGAGHKARIKKGILLSVVGGVVWEIGTLSSFVAASAPRELQVGPAISYALGQGSTMVGAFWGIVIWKEFAGGSPLVNRMIVLMFALFLIGLAVVSIAPLYVR